MKKSKLLLLCVFVLTILIACGPAPDPNGTDAESDGDVFPRPTITPIPQEGEAESLPGPEATTDADEYPAPPEQVTQPESAYPGEGEQVTQPESAYPAAGETVWVVFPVGVQCEEGGVYATLDDAVTALDEAGVVVTDQGTVELMVAAACGQPTSEHYQAQILADGLSEAESLGWELYDN